MSDNATMVKLFIVQGDTAIVQIALTNPDCTPIDLTNFGVTFTIKRSHFDTDADALFQGTLLDGSITFVDSDPTTGLIQVVIPHDNTVLMRQGKPYYWDVQLEDAANKLSTPTWGLIFATMEVTQSV
jgi:hypothetical protein